ncbi:hypothetical protein ACGF07_32040 [Kitasatospora sp. NPDC048194]|uniref:hypothetical protein n=1 Tax=Kitasatospora sp. NPDC048194 TaxID=3364045 RepID=UPI00371DFB42
MTDLVDTYAELGARLGTWLTAPSPLTADALLDCLRAAEAGTTGEVRSFWGFAAMNWQASISATADTRPSVGELRAVAIEYAEIARSRETANAGQ